MSAISGFFETCQNLKQLHKRALREEAEEEGARECEVGGLPVAIKLYYDGPNSTRRTVFIAGYEFALEIECVPWNILQAIKVYYWVWTDLPRHKVDDLLDRMPSRQESMSPMEEFYPTESAPRWNVHARNLEDVVALYKIWAPKYKPKK